MSLGGNAGLTVAVINEAGRKLPARCVLTDGRNRFVDPVGRGIPHRPGCIAGGFYTRGGFSCRLFAGMCSLTVESGHEFLPLARNLALEPDRHYSLRVTLRRWFSPREMNWHGGDIHFHVFHGGTYTPVATRLENGDDDYDFVKLAAQAEGLDYLVGGLAGNNSQIADDEKAEKLSGRGFIFRLADEKQYIWSGHATIVGYHRPVKHNAIVSKPLPLLRIRKVIEKHSGIINYTHPAGFPPMNWISAIEVFSHAALGEQNGLFDVGAQAAGSPLAQGRRELQLQELFFFWSIGMKLGACASSDAPLERGQRLGSGRTYVRTSRFTYGEIVRAMNKRHTVASVGPVFARLLLDRRHLPGAEVSPGRHTLRVEAYARAGLSTVELIVDGKPERLYRPHGRKRFSRENLAVDLDPGSWVTVLARDAEGGFSLPSAFFAKGGDKTRGDFCMLCLSDVDRTLKATGKMFLHLIATVGEGDYIKDIVISRNDERLFNVASSEGSNVPRSGVLFSVKRNTRREVSYCQTGWLFYPRKERARHFQLSLEMSRPGWYEARVKLKSGRVITSGGVRHRGAASATTGILQFSGQNAAFWLEACAAGRNYDRDPYCWSFIKFTGGDHCLDQIGRKEQSRIFRRPEWIKL